MIKEKNSRKQQLVMEIAQEVPTLFEEEDDARVIDSK